MTFAEAARPYLPQSCPPLGGSDGAGPSSPPPHVCIPAADSSRVLRRTHTRAKCGDENDGCDEPALGNEGRIKILKAEPGARKPGSST